MSTSAPKPVAPAPKPESAFDKIRKEVVAVVGALVAAGEAILVILPAGSVTSALQIALPFIGGLAARSQTVSLATVNQFVAALRARK